ncbi:hypothetical protein D3C85_1829220 [compost metagenome]
MSDNAVKPPLAVVPSEGAPEILIVASKPIAPSTSTPVVLKPVTPPVNVQDAPKADGKMIVYESFVPF